MTSKQRRETCDLAERVWGWAQYWMHAAITHPRAWRHTLRTHYVDDVALPPKRTVRAAFETLVELECSCGLSFYRAPKWRVDKLVGRLAARPTPLRRANGRW